MNSTAMNHWRIPLRVIWAGMAICLAAAVSGREEDLPGFKDPAESGETNLQPAPSPVRPRGESTLTNMLFRPVGPGLFELGKVRFSKTERTVTFPGHMNLPSGPIEYFLVTTYGKTHESVLRTDTEPIHIQLALLLLGAKGDPDVAPKFFPEANAAPPASPAAPVSTPDPRMLRGDKVKVDVSWTSDGKRIKRPAEELAFNLLTGKPLVPGKWVYNGSVVRDGVFYGQAEGSVISLITDPAALINNVARGHENDDAWIVNTNRVPAVDTPVEVTIRLK